MNEACVVNTPLHTAVRNDDLVMVQALIEKGIQINQTDEAGYSSLYIASFKGNLEIVNTLLGHEDIDVNLADKDGSTPLHAATMYGNKNVVNALLRHEKININQVDEHGYSPLHIAVIFGDTDIVSVLLDHNADINIGNNAHKTALHISIRKGHFHIAQALLAQKGLGGLSAEGLVKKSNDGKSALEFLEERMDQKGRFDNEKEEEMYRLLSNAVANVLKPLYLQESLRRAQFFRHASPQSAGCKRKRNEEREDTYIRPRKR